MEMIKIENSSNVDQYGYENGTLLVSFKNGSHYNYYDVPAKLFEDLQKAESKGKFLNENIKGKYKYDKLQITKVD